MALPVGVMVAEVRKGCRLCVPRAMQLSGVKYQSTAWWVSAPWKQLEPNNLEGRRGPSGSSTVVQEPALAPLANIALLCVATWGRVPKRRERITEEKQ